MSEKVKKTEVKETEIPVEETNVEERMLTLEAFEEASEAVKKVTQETKLIYSKYFSERTGNKGLFQT